MQVENDYFDERKGFLIFSKQWTILLDIINVALRTRLFFMYGMLRPMVEVVI